MDFATLIAPGPDASLAALFVASFLAATLLPGGSEVVLGGVVLAHPELRWPALLWATLGNTLGGMSSYWLGRLLPERAAGAARWFGRVQRHGTPILLLSWVPLVGDAFCVAAGWLRLSPAWSAFFMAAGKGARYGVLLALLP